jgi:hypothetical protein
LRPFSRLSSNGLACKVIGSAPTASVGVAPAGNQATNERASLVKRVYSLRTDVVFRKSFLLRREFWPKTRVCQRTGLAPLDLYRRKADQGWRPAFNDAPHMNDSAGVMLRAESDYGIV